MKMAIDTASPLGRETTSRLSADSDPTFLVVSTLSTRPSSLLLPTLPQTVAHLPEHPAHVSTAAPCGTVAPVLGLAMHVARMGFP